MALIANDPTDRAEQLLLVTERLMALIVEETRRIDAREPPLDDAEAEEKQRLANAYRLELARIKQEPQLIDTAPGPLLAQLRERTAQLQDVLHSHEVALDAIKAVAEGLVHAMAEEVVRQRSGGANYGSGGSIEASASPTPAVLDRQA